MCAPTASARLRRRRHRRDVDHCGAVDFVDLAAQELDQMLTAELDHELVHRVAIHPLENVNGDDVPAHGPDPAGYEAQRAGTIGQGDANEISGHGAEVRRSV